MSVLPLLVSCAMHQVVPTIDTARFTLLAKRLLAMGRSVFLGGPSGCGKTVLMSQIAAMGKGTSLAANTSSSSGSGAARGVGGAGCVHGGHQLLWAQHLCGHPAHD